MSGTTSRRLGGITTIAIDGSAYDVVSDVTWSPSSLKRETLLGLDGVHGYSEMPIAGFISMQLRDQGGITVGDFVSMTNSNVQINLANGKQIIGTGMWVVEAIEVKAQEGTFEVKFEGNDVTEITV